MPWIADIPTPEMAVIYQGGGKKTEGSGDFVYPCSSHLQAGFFPPAAGNLSGEGGQGGELNVEGKNNVN